MKIPLAYPKIPDTTNCPLTQCTALEKIDGTNLHFVWDQDSGWTEFGTRRNRFSLNQNGINEFHHAHPGLSDCIDLFNEQIKPLGDYLLSAKYSTYSEITIFTEYAGKQSFAGQHQPNDPKRLYVIDVLLDSEFLPLTNFVTDFGTGLWLPLDCFPTIVYNGKYSGQFVQDIRSGKYPVNEGVIVRSPHPKHNSYRAKIKTHAYMERLQHEFKDNWHNYWE